MTVLAHDLDDMHHDVTWLIGALARDLMARGRNPGVLEMLAKLSACDFSSRNLVPARASGAAGHALPEAVTAALESARESASALAAAHEHLDWREAAPGAARAVLLGPQGPMRAAAMELSILLLEAGAALALEAAPRDGLFFVLSGASRWRTQGAALLALQAGQTLFVSAGHGLEIRAGQAPLLAARLTG